VYWNEEQRAWDNYTVIVNYSKIGGRPIAFTWRRLSRAECKYLTAEMEATSIVEAVRKWGHYLYPRYFTVNADQ